MNNIITKLNTIIKSPYRVFPTLLVISPLSSSAVTIDPSTTSIQNFSQDRSYTTNEGVSISTSKSEPAVWENGDVTSSNDNGFTVDVMSETIDNSCNIVGKNYSILIGDQTSTIIMVNDSLAEVNTALSSGVIITFTNEGIFKCTQDNVVKLSGLATTF